MTGVPLQLLLIEDSPDDVELLRIELDNGGYRPSLQVVTDAAGLRAALTGRAWDVVVSDHNLPTFDSSSALAIVREHDRNLPFIIVSGCLGEEAAVEAMKAGADDYVMKGRFGRLLPAIQRGLREARLRRERREALREIEESGARLQILTGNIPCLVFQLARGSDGSLGVPYLSGRLKSLFGLAAGAAASDALFRPFGLDGRALRQLFTVDAPETVAWSGPLRHAGETLWLDLRAHRRSTDDGSMVWDAVFFDISERVRAEQEVHELNGRLRELSARADSGREQERARIARELHDDLGGSLSALKIDLVMLKQGSGGPERLDAMIRLTEETVQAVRRICADLHPRILDELGLDAALHWQSERVSGHTGLVCDYEGELGDAAVGPATAVALFRIYQEILTNVVRHADARRVTARLREEGGSICLDVADDGLGIAPERLAGSGSLGLLGMRERVREIGGSITVGQASPRGTRVLVQVPRDGEALAKPADEGVRTGITNRE